MQNSAAGSTFETLPKAEPSAWIAYFLMGLLCISASLATGLAPYFSPPVVGRPAGIVFSPLSDGLENIAQLLSADPDLALVDSWYSDHIIFVISNNPDFSKILRKTSAIHAFDAIEAGCHINLQTD